jgi:transcriptional regulator with XRE-family HTH domain
MPAKTAKRKRRSENTSEAMEAIAEKTGLSFSTLRIYQKNGVDIHDDDALRDYVKKHANRTKTLNVEWLGVEPAPENADIQTLKDELTRTIDRNVAQRIKTQIDGLLSAQKLEVLNASYISMIDVKDAFTKLGSVIRAGIMRMQADLPPALEGQSPSRMAKIIGESSEKLLTELSETESELWQID